MRSRQLLQEARAALAKGDSHRATLLVGQARQLGVNYPLNADSPDKIEALIAKAAAFAKGPAAGADAAGYTREFAQFLLDQSAGLLAYGAYDDAQQLAQQSKDLRANFGQFDRTPEQMLTQIATARKQAQSDLAGSSNPLPPWGGPEADAASGGIRPRRLPLTDSDSAAGGVAANKTEALRLIAEAQAALDRGDLLTAKQAAEQAQNLAPESAYAANETRPWMVLLEVNKALQSRGGVAPAAHYESPTQNALATDANSGGAYPVSQGIYDPAKDPSRNVAAQFQQPTPAMTPDGAILGRDASVSRCATVPGRPAGVGRP